MDILKMTKTLLGSIEERPSINSVFTPRAAEVNDDMYIPRPELEKSLTRGLSGTLHVIIHGESGAGKSWLYKKVLRQIGAGYKVANCANVARHGSFDREFDDLLNHFGGAEETGYKEKNKQRSMPFLLKRELIMRVTLPSESLNLLRHCCHLCMRRIYRCSWSTTLKL